MPTSSVDQPGPPPGDREALEFQQLQVQVQKLRLEVEALRATSVWDRVIGRYLPLLTAILAVAGFWFGGIQYYGRQTESDRQRAEAEGKRAEELRREAARPCWDWQVQIYLRGAEAAGTIATSLDAEAVKRAEAQFWTLYWGPLAIVEDVGTEPRPSAEVEAAMVRFGRYLGNNKDRNRG